MVEEEPKSSSSKSAKAAEDRLSMLPQELLLKILSLTKSYKTAVKCSMISHSWRELYTSLPSLYLKQADFMPVQSNRSYRPRPRQCHEAKLRFLQRLAMALFWHSADLETYSLEAAGPDQIIWNHSLRFLDKSKSSLKNLSLCNSESNQNPDPPLELVSAFSSLESLSLTRFKLLQCQISGFQGSRRLRVLKLRKLCNWDSLAMEKIIANCPVLQELSVSVPCSKVNAGFTVSSPSLLKFEFECCDLRYYDARKHKQIRVTLDAVNLVQIRVPSMNVDLHGNGGMPEVLKQGLVEAKWMNGEMIGLEAQNVRDDADFLVNVGALCGLSKLKLSNLKVSSLDLWETLAQLRHLQTLSLAGCKFENEVDVLPGICNTNDSYESFFQNSLANLPEEIHVKRITLTGFMSIFSLGFQLFLCLVLQRAPVLDCLYLNFTKYSQYKDLVDITEEYNWKHIIFVEQLMSAIHGAPLKHICGDSFKYALYQGTGNLKVLNITQDPSRTCFHFLFLQNATVNRQCVEPYNTYDFSYMDI